MLPCNDPFAEDLPFPENRRPEESVRLKLYTDRLEHDIFYLYVFLTSEGLDSEACEFLDSHEDDDIPFRFRQI